MISYHNFTLNNLLTGIGLQALAGTMGVTAPMAHNNYVDLFVSGGIFHFGSFMYLAFNLIRKFHNGIQFRLLASFVVLFLINMFIGAATFYQPVCCIAIVPILFSCVNQSNGERSYV